MKVIIAVSTIFASIAAAANCQSGLDYCSFTLMGKGNYHSEILDALRSATPSIDPSQVNYDYYLYRCDAEGGIHKTQNCPWGCEDGGDNNSDRCT